MVAVERDGAEREHLIGCELALHDVAAERARTDPRGPSASAPRCARSRRGGWARTARSRRSPVPRTRRARSPTIPHGARIGPYCVNAIMMCLPSGASPARCAVGNITSAYGCSDWPGRTSRRRTRAPGTPSTARAPSAPMHVAVLVPRRVHRELRQPDVDLHRARARRYRWMSRTTSSGSCSSPTRSRYVVFGWAFDTTAFAADQRPVLQLDADGPALAVDRDASRPARPSGSWRRPPRPRAPWPATRRPCRPSPSPTRRSGRRPRRSSGASGRTPSRASSARTTRR